MNNKGFIAIPLLILTTLAGLLITGVKTGGPVSVSPLSPFYSSSTTILPRVTSSTLKVNAQDPSGNKYVTSTTAGSGNQNGTTTLPGIPYAIGNNELQTTSTFVYATSTNRVGIGTASPSSTLHVIGTATVSATTTIQGKLLDASGNAYVTSSVGAGSVTTSTAVTTGYFPFWGTTSGLTGTSTLFASSTRIGLGTISPSSTLHVIGDIVSTATSTFPEIRLTTFSPNGPGIYADNDTNTGIYFEAPDVLSLKTGGGLAVVSLTATGRVGINTTAPSSSFHVVGAATFTATTTVQGNLVDVGGNKYVTSTGAGSVTTSTPITANHVPYWVTTGGGLAGTSTLTISGTAVNASGTISQSGTAVALSNTTISAGGLLTGGGDLSTNRTITFASSSLGLGTASVQNVGAFLQPSNNLSELTATSTARTNLGLGSIATFASTDYLASSTTKVISVNGINGVALFAAAGPGLTVASSSQTITYTFSSSSLNLGTASILNSPIPVANGGTATGTAPFDLSILTGEGGAYAQKTLTAGTNVTISTTTGAITINSSGGAGSITTSTAVTANYFPFWGTTSALTGTSTLYASSTRIGIGTISPSSTLHVIGDIKATGNIYDNAGNAYVTSTTAGSGTVTTSTAVTTGYFSTWGTASALTGTSTIFASSTRVGIGTISPSSTLHVIGDFQTSGVLLPALGAVTAPAYSFFGDANTGMWSSAADTLNFSTGGSERLRVSSGGLVGIGTTSPSTTLHVVGGLQVTATTTLQGQTTIDDLYMGASTFANDAGQTTWIDLPVSTAVATNTVQSYTARIDGNAALTIYSKAVGDGTVNGIRVGVGTSTPATSTMHIWSTASTTLRIGSATVASCIIMGDDDLGGVTYVTALNGVLSATTTKPSACIE